MTLFRPRSFYFVLALVCLAATVAWSQASYDRAAEERIIDYLREHVKPGQRVVVSELYNNVFTSPEERKVLDRLFNIFFKIPLFVAQYHASTASIPSLADIARQFNLPVKGEAAVLLSIIDNDPRVPKFMTRDSESGEITAVDVEMVKNDRRFGTLLERTLIGWEGKTLPPFSIQLNDGSTATQADFDGKNMLIYFWFSGCPPCMSTSPHLVELYGTFSKDNFTVLGVNADRFLELDVTDADRGEYIKKVNITFPMGHLNEKMQQDFGNINVYPTMFLVDSKGLIRKHYVNYQPLEVLSADISTVVNSN